MSPMRWGLPSIWPGIPPWPGSPTPGSSTSPYHALARRYCRHGPGAVFSFGVKGGYAGGQAFIEAVELASHLANVGDTRTLVIHPPPPPTADYPTRISWLRGSGPTWSGFRSASRISTTSSGTSNGPWTPRSRRPNDTGLRHLRVRECRHLDSAVGTGAPADPQPDTHHRRGRGFLQPGSAQLFRGDLPSQLQHRLHRVVCQPAGEEPILGHQVYPTLADLPASPDLVDVFRRADDLPRVASEAVAARARTFWAQLGLWNDEAAEIAFRGGLSVVMNRCVKIEHARFAGGLHLAGFDTGVINSKRARRPGPAGPR